MCNLYIIVFKMNKYQHVLVILWDQTIVSDMYVRHCGVAHYISLYSTYILSVIFFKEFKILIIIFHYITNYHFLSIISQFQYNNLDKSVGLDICILNCIFQSNACRVIFYNFMLMHWGCETNRELYIWRICDEKLYTLHYPSTLHT